MTHESDGRVPNCSVLDRELRALHVLMDARFKSAEVAVAATERTLNHRFEQTNEWRAQLDRERTEFAKGIEVIGLRADIKRLEDFQSRMVGALGLAVFLGLAGFIALLRSLAL